MKKNAVMCFCALAAGASSQNSGKPIVTAISGKPSWKYRYDAPLDVKEKPSSASSSSSSSAATVAKQSKKKHQPSWKTSKAGFEHEYLVTNLMGHTGNILAMDCTTDGKYLVTCAEDEPPPDPGDFITSSGSSTSSSSSSSSSGSLGGAETPESSSPSAVRRQPRRRRKARAAAAVSPLPFPSPPVLERYTMLKVNEVDLARLLTAYQVPPENFQELGYPYYDESTPAQVMIFSTEFKQQTPKFDVNAREFIPKGGRRSWVRDNDSGRSSGSSSPRSDNSDADSEEGRAPGEDSCVPVVEERCAPMGVAGTERRCVRCAKAFFVTSDGQYVTRERCRYHWGKPQRMPFEFRYTCCGSPQSSEGCSHSAVHVWSGMSAGFNGPYGDFVRTRPRTPGAPKRHVLALDCEMCYTAEGLQIAQVEVIGPDGHRVYGSFVRPEAPVVDYNTRFSGICARDLRDATKNLKDIQNDLLALIDAETILVGHGLENDLRVLKLTHERIVDSAVTYPHIRGLPYRRPLRLLAAQFLDLPVQEHRHCPLEDARASLELMLLRVQVDLDALRSPAFQD